MIQPGGSAIEQKKTSYDWKYEYGSSHPHAPTHLGERTYKYDANGNQLGWDNDRNGTRRNIVWDDENRIQSVFDNGHEKSYKYDDQGERVIKRGPQGETAYVNQWYTVRNREVASKHVYAGTTRIATSLVPGVKPVGGGAAAGTTGTTTSTDSKLPIGAQQAPGILAGQGIAHRSAQAAQHSRNLEKNPHYAGGTTGAGTASNQDNFLYYYHPDHLGSSSYVTDSSGKVFEHLEYFPFGETWVEESSNTQRTPYLFTAKELDEETGLYYFGARYYDPRVSVWQSTDRILNGLLDGKHNDGVFTPTNLSVYSYAYQSPIRLIDPDGNNPGPVYVPGIFPMADYKTGNVVVDNTVLGVVNTAANLTNSVANLGLRAVGMVGEVLPDPGAIQSAGMAGGPQIGSAARGVGAFVRGLVSIGRMDREAVATSQAATVTAKELRAAGRADFEAARSGKLAENGGMCTYCSVEPSKEVDHVKSLKSFADRVNAGDLSKAEAAKKANAPGNLAGSCVQCNRGPGGKHAKELSNEPGPNKWVAPNGFYPE